MKNERFNKKGFTLVELMVVLVILGVIAGIAIPALTGYMDKSKEKECASNRASILSFYSYAHSVDPTVSMTDVINGNDAISGEDVANIKCPSGGTYSAYYDETTKSVMVWCTEHGCDTISTGGENPNPKDPVAEKGEEPGADESQNTYTYTLNYYTEDNALLNTVTIQLTQASAEDALGLDTLQKYAPDGYTYKGHTTGASKFIYNVVVAATQSGEEETSKTYSVSYYTKKGNASNASQNSWEYIEGSKIESLETDNINQWINDNKNKYYEQYKKDYPYVIVVQNGQDVNIIYSTKQ